MAKLDSVRQKITELRKLEDQLAVDLKQCERRLRNGGENHDACPENHSRTSANRKETAPIINLVTFECCCYCHPLFRRRVAHYWDKDRLISKSMGEHNKKSIVWDQHRGVRTRCDGASEDPAVCRRSGG